MKKNNEPWKIFMNYRRMRHIRRCNNFPTLQQEDVAQHSYYTTMLAMLFKDECDKYNPENSLNGEMLLRKCLLHDTEEAFTSDIPYPIKHCDEVVHSRLEDAVNHKMMDLSEQSQVLINWEIYRQECKSGIEGKVVAFCDMLELALYSYEELTLGNRSMTVMLDNCNEYLEDLAYEALNAVFPEEKCHLQTFVPTIWELFSLVQRDSNSGNYVFKDYVTDLT